MPPALFQPVALLADALAAEPGRLKKRAAIAAAIARTRHESTPEDAGRFAQYLAGLPFAEADPRKLNAGGALLTKAVLTAAGATGPQLTEAFRRHGDLGAAAFDLLAAQPERPPELTLEDLAEAFAAMAVAKTTAIRAALLDGLLRRATPVEAKYLIKLMLGDMRIGVKQSLVEESIAVAASQARQEDEATEVAAVRHAVMLEADLARATVRAFEGTLAQARMTLFHPLGFMLASPVDTPEEAVARFTAKPAKPVPAPKPPKSRKSPKGNPKPALPPREVEITHGGPDLSPLEDVLSDLQGGGGVYPASTELNLPAASIELEPTAVVSSTSGPAAASGPTPSRPVGPSGGPDLSPLEDALSDLPVGRGGYPAQPASDHPSGPDAHSAFAPAVHAFLEDKFDGMRAQIHCGDPRHPGRVAIYSRNREDITESFPELCEAFAHVDPSTDGPMILDGEILAWNFGTGASDSPSAPPRTEEGQGSVSNPPPETAPRALPFAILGTRIGRKKVSNAVRTEVPVIFMAFDLLFHRGDLLLDLPLRDRRNRLEALTEGIGPRVVSPFSIDERRKAKQGTIFSEPEAAGVRRLLLSTCRMVESAEDIDRAYAEARARANEGVMLKAAASAYLPGRRGLAWVKLKRELASLDVVITGAEYGNGRRAPFLSDYTFAIRDAAGNLLNVGKAYSGVTDAEIVELTEFLKAHTLEDHGHFRTVEPLVILEVAFNNIMRSARHASGFALRFPRILRIRTDKPLGEIDTLARVEEIYLSQVDRPAEETADEATEPPQ